jgi:type II secretory pathway pseudopilin PulG
MILSSKFKNFERGITLVEVIVSIFIITMFSLIVITDFPKIKRQFALSRATYKLAQNIRRTEDLGLSGVQVLDASGDPITTKGYGFYINTTDNDKQYIIYADTNLPTDYQYTVGDDYIVETVDLLEDEPGVYIKQILDTNTNMSTDWVSVNFNPPNPTILITTDSGNTATRVGISLSLELDQSVTRTIYVNSSGLVEVE